MTVKRKEWTEYSVRCRRWFRHRSYPGKKIWETVNLSAASEEQALYFYNDIKAKVASEGKEEATLINPVIVVREIVEYPYRHRKPGKRRHRPDD